MRSMISPGGSGGLPGGLESCWKGVSGCAGACWTVLYVLGAPWGRLGLSLGVLGPPREAGRRGTGQMSGDV
eukprot:1548710-Pyramimonas_sp.AAC.1